MKTTDTCLAHNPLHRNPKRGRVRFARACTCQHAVSHARASLSLFLSSLNPVRTGRSEAEDPLVFFFFSFACLTAAWLPTRITELTFTLKFVARERALPASGSFFLSRTRRCARADRKSRRDVCANEQDAPRGETHFRPKRQLNSTICSMHGNRATSTSSNFNLRGLGN